MTIRTTTTVCVRMATIILARPERQVNSPFRCPFSLRRVRDSPVRTAAGGHSSTDGKWPAGCSVSAAEAVTPERTFREQRVDRDACSASAASARSNGPHREPTMVIRRRLRAPTPSTAFPRGWSSGPPFRAGGPARGRAAGRTQILCSPPPRPPADRAADRPEDRPAGPRRPPPRAFPGACRPSARSGTTPRARARTGYRADRHQARSPGRQPSGEVAQESRTRRPAGSVNTATSVAIESATRCRLRCGTET